MNDKSIFADSLLVLDDELFTGEKFKEWYNILLCFAGETINILRKEIGNITGISFEINTVLLQEVVYDAIIGLRTIVVSKNNKIKDPNPFKVASYLGYWFLRHKPIIFRVEKNLNIDTIVFPSDIEEKVKKDIIVEIKYFYF